MDIVMTDVYNWIMQAFELIFKNNRIMWSGDNVKADEPIARVDTVKVLYCTTWLLQWCFLYSHKVTVGVAQSKRCES